MILVSAFQASIEVPFRALSNTYGHLKTNMDTRQKLQDRQKFQDEVTFQFTEQLEAMAMLKMSDQLLDQFKDALQEKAIYMAPSAHLTLPKRDNNGQYIVIDIGGSVLRVALVEVRIRGAGDQAGNIQYMRSWRMNESVRALKDEALFDWIASKIKVTMSDPANPVRTKYHDCDLPPISVAWSFPVEFGLVSVGMRPLWLTIG